jgi:hypothetical protein
MDLREVKLGMQWEMHLNGGDKDAARMAVVTNLKAFPHYYTDLEREGILCDEDDVLHIDIPWEHVMADAIEGRGENSRGKKK